MPPRMPLMPFRPPRGLPPRELPPSTPARPPPLPPPLLLPPPPPPPLLLDDFVLLAEDLPAVLLAGAAVFCGCDAACAIGATSNPSATGAAIRRYFTYPIVSPFAFVDGLARDSPLARRSVDV